MAGAYEHIRIEKEPLINDRRTRKPSGFGGVSRDDWVAHGKRLGEALTAAARTAKAQPGAEDGNLILKFNYSGSLDLSKLNKHGVEFVSQEDKTVCVIFATFIAAAGGCSRISSSLWSTPSPSHNSLTCLLDRFRSMI